MAFMERQITANQQWVKVDGNCGIDFIPADLFTGDLTQLTDEDVADYTESRNIYSIELITGFGARLSAPGYMDCTEWSVFDTEQEAEQYLDDYYGDDEDDEQEAE